MGKIIDDQIQDVVRIHTDGFIMKKQLKNGDFGSGIGQLKIEDKYCDVLEIIHTNNIKGKKLSELKLC